MSKKEGSTRRFFGIITYRLRFSTWLWLRFCAWLWLWFRARLRARRKTFMMCFSRICLTISTISSSLCFSSFSS